MKIIDALGGRKNFLTILCLIAAVVIDLTTERGLSENMLILMLGITGTYSVTNVLAKKFGGATETHASSEPVQEVSAPSEEVLSEIAALKQNQQLLEQYASGLLTTVENLQSQVDASNKRVAALISARQ